MEDSAAQGVALIDQMRNFKFWLDLSGNPLFIIVAIVIAVVAVWKNIKSLFLFDLVVAGTLMLVHYTAPDGTMDEISANIVQFLIGLVIVIALFIYFGFLRNKD